MFFGHRKKRIKLGDYGRLRLNSYKVGESQRNTHTYVAGITGKGKSKFLESVFVQDVLCGHGCGVLDPHSDLIDDILRNLLSREKHFSNHLDRIIYFDPSRDDYVVPFNVLDSEFGPAETTENVIEAFRRAWPKALDEAPRFADVATNAILALYKSGLSLIEMERLLSDREFREQVLSQIDDVVVKSFFHNRYDRWGRDAPMMVESLLNKVSAFTSSPHLRVILGAKTNALRFKDIMDRGQVLLLDLGRCDAKTRRLVGSLVATGFERASRTRRDSRKPYHLYMDEFQIFCSNDGAATTFSQILSECRKYGLLLTLAHQTQAQLSERIRGAISNIQLKVIFGVGRDDAEIHTKDLFQVNPQRVKHQVKDVNQQQRSHPMFYSLPEQWEETIQRIQNLPSRAALIKAKGRGVTQITTSPVKYKDGVDIDELKQKLAKRSGVPKQSLEEIFLSRYQDSSNEFKHNEPVKLPSSKQLENTFWE